MRDRLFETIDTGCLNDEDLPWMPYAPDGAMLTVESSMRNVLPVNMANGFAPNRNGGNQGFLRKAV